jgi:hypothetical protein
VQHVGPQRERPFRGSLDSVSNLRRSGQPKSHQSRKVRIEYRTTEPILAVGRGTYPPDSRLAQVLRLTPHQMAASRRRSMPRVSWRCRHGGTLADGGRRRPAALEATSRCHSPRAREIPAFCANCARLNRICNYRRRLARRVENSQHYCSVLGSISVQAGTQGRSAPQDHSCSFPHPLKTV